VPLRHLRRSREQKLSARLMSNSDIQHKPAIRLGVDSEAASSDAAWENDSLVPVQGFEFPEDLHESDLAEQDQGQLAFSQRQAACFVLALICDGDTSAKVIGKRALALAYALKASPCENQIALAKRMGVSPARANQILMAVKRGTLGK
jgi:hypothetical protein